MPRYIDADVLKHELCIRQHMLNADSLWKTLEIMDAQPTADVVERKKGKWIRITQGAIPEQYICPFCHRTVESYGVEELLSIRYPYCHCGADMRGENRWN